VQIVKIIKASPSCSRLSKLLCTDTGHEYKTFIFHTKFHWLLYDKVLMTVFKLSEKMQFFWSKKRNSISQIFLRCFLLAATTRYMLYNHSYLFILIP